MRVTVGLKQSREKPMYILGVTGGIGAGKSSVLAYLQEQYDGFFCQADQIAESLQQSGEACYEEIVQAFGGEILHREGNGQGEINREKLAALVFSDPKKLARLNEIVHPKVELEVRKNICRQRRKKTKLFVLEAALLLESGYDTFCNELWYISAPKELRGRRLCQERGYSYEQIEKRMDCQLSEEYFRRACHFAVENTGTFSETIQQVKQRMDYLGFSEKSQEIARG